MTDNYLYLLKVRTAYKLTTQVILPVHIFDTQATLSMRHTNTQAITLDAINVLDLFYINVGFLSLSITLC